MATKSKTKRNKGRPKEELIEELRITWDVATDLWRLLSLPKTCWCGTVGPHEPRDTHTGCNNYRPVGILSPRKLRLWIAACYSIVLENGSAAYMHQGVPAPLPASWMSGDPDQDASFGPFPITPEMVSEWWADPINDNPRDSSLELRTLLLRNIFGNPFIPPDWSALYQTREVVSIAREIWNTAGVVCNVCKGTGVKCREPHQPGMTILTEIECSSCQGSKRIGQRLDRTAFPILADALEDSGCTSSRILAHLRSGARSCGRATVRVGEGVGRQTTHCTGSLAFTPKAGVREGIWTCDRCGCIEASEGPLSVRGDWVVDLCLGLE